VLTAQWCQKETKVTSAQQDPGHGLADARRHREEQRHADQDRTLLAMQQLEAALGSAAPRREEAWLTEVRRTLGVLSEAARDEADNAAQPDSLLSDIARTQPWLRNRARGLRVHYGQIRDAIAALRKELDSEAAHTADFTDIRQRLTWVLAGLRHQRARESDLIYEAYYDAFRSDLAQDAVSPGGPADPTEATAD
jgi:hypothetical protein